MELLDHLGNKVPEDAYIIRATELGQFINCPRNWFFMSHNGLNLEPKVRPQKLRFGLVWHKGMEYLYSGKDPFMGMLEEFKKEEELIYGVAAYDADMAAAIDDERELARLMMEGYLAWRETASPPDSSFTTKAVERRVLIALNGCYLAVRFDGEVIGKGGLWVLEHKTRGKSSSVDNPPELALDLQMGLQLLAASLTNPESVRGAIYNLARKMKPSNRVKTPLFGRHEVVRTKDELSIIQKVVEARAAVMKIYTGMANAYKKNKELGQEIMEVGLTYNPQPLGLCSWGCSVRNICESINRREDAQYLVDVSLKSRDKTIWDVLQEEISEN